MEIELNNVSRRTDGRWSTAAVCWEPAEGHRRVGRPTTRWRDALDAFAAEYWDLGEKEWFLLAPDRPEWDSAVAEYARSLRSTQPWMTGE